MTDTTDEHGEPHHQGHRKDGRPFKDGNTRPDGSYAVGKNRAPPEGRFAVDDGRPRGRRNKGVPNNDTELRKEFNRKVRIKESGKERIVSKAMAIYLRLIDNAANKGQNRAIELADDLLRRLDEKQEANSLYHSKSDLEIFDQYLKERGTALSADAWLGDPEPAPGPARTDDDEPQDGESSL